MAQNPNINFTSANSIINVNGTIVKSINVNDPTKYAAGQPVDPAQAPPGSPQAAQQDQQKQQQGQDQINQLQQTLDALKKSLGQPT